MLKSAVALLAVVLLAACFKSGTKVSDAQVDQIEKGKTTYSEVVGIMGRPDMTSRNSDGTRQIIYNHVTARADGKSYIPFAGAFIGGTTGESRTVEITFDGNDVVKEYSVVDGTHNTTRGY